MQESLNIPRPIWRRPRRRKYPLIDTPEKFWAQAVKMENGCWEFVGTRTPRGYAMFWLDETSIYAHRHALELKKGPAPSEKHVAMHICDNPPCCNPDHLKWATQLKNMKDAKRKGRLKRRG